MLDAEIVEHRDDDLADVVLAAVAVRQRLEQQIDPALDVPGVQRGERIGQVRFAGLLEAQARLETVGLEVADHRLEHALGLVALAALHQQPCQRHGRLGAAGLELDRAAQRRFVAGGGEALRLARDQRREEALDGRWALGADELADHAPVAERLDRRDPLDAEGLRQILVGVRVDLGEVELAVVLARLALEQRGELAAGAAPLRPEVDDDRHLARPVDHARLEVLFRDVEDGHAVEDRPRVLSVEDSGQGPAVVLLHGLTATKRYVVMGSKALERSGHRVIAYDARGHGASDPAPSPDAYTYPELAGDLVALLDERGVERATLAGASMGAHTLLRFALEHPERVAALVVITPAYTPQRDPGLERWDRLSDGLRNGGVEGFVAAYGEPPVPERWRETVLTILRQRLSRHEHPDAVADALRAVPRSAPFGSLADLRALDAPAGGLGPRDQADPEHPAALGGRPAQGVPRDRPGGGGAGRAAT